MKFATENLDGKMKLIKKISNVLQQSSSNILKVIIVNCILAVVSFVKDVYLAAYLGTSAIADAFLLSYFIVDTLGNNFLAMALGVAVIPVFSKIFISKTNKDFNAAIAGVLLFSTIACLFLSLILFLNGPLIYAALGSGLDATTQSSGLIIFNLLIPILTFFPIIYLGMAILQVQSRFISSMTGQIVFNGLLLLGLIYLNYTKIYLEKGVFILTGFLIASVLAQFAYIWIFVIKDCKCLPEFGRIKDTLGDLLEILKNLLPYLSVLGSTQIIYFVERYFAAKQGPGTLAALNYAFRLVQFPIWVFISAVAVVAFPEIARKAYSKDNNAFSDSVNKYLFLGILFTLPFTIMLYTLRYPIITTLFQRGEFNSYSVEVTATILSGYVFCIVWQGISALLVRVSMLKGSKRIPLVAAIPAMSINILLLRYWVPSLGPIGIGYAAACGAFTNAMLLYFLLWKYLRPLKFIKNVLLLSGANTLLLFTCLFLKGFWVNVGKSSEITSFSCLILIGLICLSVYCLSYYLFWKIAVRFDNT